MIKFEKIRWKNFLSTGNTFTEIDLIQHKTNLIVGNNGTGKSTILDALTFALYNRAFRKISRSQLINTVNERDTVVEIEFSILSKEYKIVRGVKPGIFEIWVDGRMQDQFPNAIDQQKYLEENILKLNYKSFTQTVILGSATFVPFMQLNAPNRRDIVEDLLDIKIFSSMGNILKDRVRENNDLVKQLSIKKDMVQDKIEMQKEFISDLDKRGREKIKEKQHKVTQLLTLSENLQKENVKNQKIIDTDLQKEAESLSKSNATIKKLSSVRSKLQQKMQNLTEDHKFFKENSVCPTCDQDIEEQFRLNKIGDIEDKARELNQAYSDLKSSIAEEQSKDKRFAEVSSMISELNNGISTNNTKITEYQRQTSELESEIQRTTSQIKNRTSETGKLKGLEDELLSCEDERKKETETKTYLEFAQSLMRDTGVKSKIIKRYLPMMNKQINMYLQRMDFYVNFTLDEDFKEHVQSPIHEKFSYDSFSEGEKMRIDLALLFTWRDIARMRNTSSTNLLILDEIFDSSLDASGTDLFSILIRYIITDANVFVISHKVDELTDKFEKVITFEKASGFSKVVS
jgi:DNA repair exonuclease SbcCD ATPase subunit|tara:strand:+ start:3597 stop:5315 length:1719 start_codon:yes stop_codon:yes gene_type:complete